MTRAVPMAGRLPPALAEPIGPSAPPPTLAYAFSALVELAPPLEQGVVDGKQMRLIPITGGRVYGPRLSGKVLPGGGDWQAIGSDGRTEVNARYSLKATDGAVIDVINSGLRTASAEVTEAITRGEPVDPGAYYFRASPRFTVEVGPHDWLRRTMFVARGVRMPTTVVIDFYAVG